MSIPASPDYIGTQPRGLTRINVTQEAPAKCTATVCKVIVPVLIGVAVVLLILLVVRLLTKKKIPPAPSNVAASRPFLRNLPQYPVQQNAAAAQVQAQALRQQQKMAMMQQQQAPPQQQPQPYQPGGGMQFSTYQSGAGASQVSQAIDQRYQQAKAIPYSDAAAAGGPQSYSQAIAGAGGQLQDWDEATFTKVVLQQNLPALVGFTSKGCSHCVRALPELQKAAPNCKIAVATVDRAKAGSLIQKYGIQGFPTILLFRGGQKVKEFSGERTAQAFSAFAQ